MGENSQLKMLDSTRHDDSVADAVSAGLAGADEDVLVVNPTAQFVPELLGELRDRDYPPSVRLFADKEVLNDVVKDFLVASTLADLIASDVVEARTTAEPPPCSLFVHDQALTSVIGAGEQTATISSEDPDIVEEIGKHYDSQWKRADEFSLRTPPISALLESLRAEIGEEVAADFETVLASRETVRDDLDEVAITLLVAARNGILQYNISKWGEDAGLASKATFSRMKSRLEEAGIIDTDKVPIEVGRPRLRLHLGDEQLEDLSLAELAEQAQSMLAEE